MFIGGSVVYLRPGKTGGTTVSDMLVKYLEPDADLSSDRGKREHICGFVDDGKTQLYHLGICETLTHLPSTVNLGECFKFATIRDPITKVYSAYTYSPELCNRWTFERFVMTQLSNYVQRVDALQIPSFLRSQHAYTHVDGELFVDDICRLETFESDIIRIFNKLGVGDVDIPHLNKRSYDGNAHYTRDMIDVVREVYAKDYELLFTGNDVSTIK